MAELAIKDDDDEPNIKHIAYHEAGHAVIGLALGYDVGSVTIRPTDRYFGRARVTAPDGPIDREKEIKVDLAGLLAGRLIDHLPLKELIANGSATGDWKHAWKTARLLNPRQAEILICSLMLETEALIRDYQQTIASVATALLEHETLTGDEIRRIAGIGLIEMEEKEIERQKEHEAAKANLKLIMAKLVGTGSFKRRI